jgi:HPt (histidine-containing phosphotransfer) domain-containing protein
MSNRPPPTDALAELAAVLGEDNVRTLVRTFLRDFPIAIDNLGTSERKDQHRIAHSMKSNARLMGALELSEQMARLEDRFSRPDGPGLAPAELAEISARFEKIAAPLRDFVGPS